MKDCNGEMDGAWGCSQDDVQNFMNDLDKDGNGLLDLDEFVAFIVSNLSMPSEERRDFREQSPLQGQLSDMMITMTDTISESLGKGDGSNILGKSMYNDLPDKMERRIQYVVERLYKKYDDDNSDSIDRDEFLKLMKDVIMSGIQDASSMSERIPNKDDALKFIKVIASTRMSNVETETELKKQDFLTFTLKVLTSSSKQRIAFAARSRMHHKLLSFFLVLITDSLDVVESDLDRVEFDKQELRAEDLLVKQREKEELEAQQNARKQKIAIDKRIKAAEAAEKVLQERAAQEKKEAATRAAEATQAAAAAAAQAHAQAAASKMEDTKSDDPSSTIPTTTTAAPISTLSPDEQKERLMTRLNMYTSFVWDKYDVDKDGSLDAKEFETFLRVITQRGDAITSEDCSRFLRQMDRSGDGKLQRDELVQFAGSGFEMDPEEAKEYASRSLMHELLVVFVNKLREAILYDEDFERQVKAAKVVEDVWLKYDTDNSGSLEAEEVRLLITEIMEWDGQKGDEVTLEEATRFIGFLDTDGDGAVDQHEFLTFICTAMDMTVDLRIQFAQRSPMHAKVSFVLLLLLKTCLFVFSLSNLCVSCWLVCSFSFTEKLADIILHLCVCTVCDVCAVCCVCVCVCVCVLQVMVFCTNLTEKII